MKLVDSLQVEIDKELQDDGIHVSIPSYHCPGGSVLSFEGVGMYGATL